MSNSTEPCAVCPAPGRLRCSRCKQIRFCSTEHQALIWSSHKHLCKPNAPLVFRQRAVRPDETRQYTTGAARQILESERMPGSSFTEESLAAQLLAASTIALASAGVDPVEKSDVTNILLAWMIAHSDHAEHDAFIYAGFILMFSIEVAATHDRPAQIEQSALSLLDGQTRQKAELQVLVLATLLEKNAPRDLVVLAVERLVAIVGEAGGLGRKALFKNTRKVVLLAAERRSSVDVNDLELPTKLEGVTRIDAIEKMKAFAALRRDLQRILGPEE